MQMPLLITVLGKVLGTPNSVLYTEWSSRAHTVKTETIEPCAMSLGLPPLVRSRVFFVFSRLPEGLSCSSFSAVFFTPIPK